MLLFREKRLVPKARSLSFCFQRQRGLARNLFVNPEEQQGAGESADAATNVAAGETADVAAATGPGFKIWAVDDVVYGPVDLPTLVEWVADERVLADTWVFSEKSDSWHKASALPDIKSRFQGASPSSSAPAPVSPLIAGIKPGHLRRVKILSDMTDQQIGRFAQFMEVVQANQFREIVKKGEPGDSMFLMLDGEARVRTFVGGKEKILATLRAGEFFGDMALFDHGPRAADVVANLNCTLLKITADSLMRLTTDAPELATPFLVAICRTLTSRIRADNKRFTDMMAMSAATAR